MWVQLRLWLAERLFVAAVSVAPAGSKEKNELALMALRYFNKLVEESEKSKGEEDGN